ncbi:MAG TPA: glycosyltransferase, partial [Saprospiraceae bacterium]|nr:glycosyltransferase [Saprospiraceae bacterium]
MYILIIPSWYFPVDSEEIAGRMFHDLAKGLRERDLDARIFYPDFSLQSTIVRTSRYLTERSVPTYRVQQWFPPKKNSFFLKWWIRKSARALLRYIRDYGRPDVIHAQSYFAAMVAAEASKKSSIPFIYTERLSSFLTGQIPKFHLKFFKPVFDLASAITCVSPALLDVMQPHSPRPIRVVPNFYDETIFHPDPTIAKNEVFTFVSIGEPAHTKGLDILFHAFAALKRKLKPLPLRLMLIDRIPEEYELNKLALSLQIEKDIHWMGLMSQEGIALL